MESSPGFAARARPLCVREGNGGSGRDCHVGQAGQRGGGSCGPRWEETEVGQVSVGQAGCGGESTGERSGPSWLGWVAGEGWTAEMGWAGAGLSLVLGSFSISSTLLYLIQTNSNLNSNHTQLIKTMHQHECNTKI